MLFDEDRNREASKYMEMVRDKKLERTKSVLTCSPEPLTHYLKFLTSSKHEQHV